MPADTHAPVTPVRLTERAANPRVLRLHPDDNLIVSIDPILPGRGGRRGDRDQPRAEGPQNGDERDRRASRS